MQIRVQNKSKNVRKSWYDKDVSESGGMIVESVEKGGLSQNSAASSKYTGSALVFDGPKVS